MSTSSRPHQPFPGRSNDDQGQVATKPKGKPPRLRTRFKDGLGQGATSAFAALLAYMSSQAFGSKEGFWGAITAIAVTQSQFKTARSTARDQFVGSVVGGFISLCVVLTAGQHWWAYVLAVIASTLFCSLANIDSARRLAGTTATIILLVPHTGTVEAMAVSRLSEVTWGVCIAIGTVWSIGRISAALAQRRHHARND